MSYAHETSYTIPKAPAGVMTVQLDFMAPTFVIRFTLDQNIISCRPHRGKHQPRPDLPLLATRVFLRLTPRAVRQVKASPSKHHDLSSSPGIRSGEERKDFRKLSSDLLHMHTLRHCVT